MAGKTVRARRSSPKRLIMPSLATLAGVLSDTFDTRVRVELGRQKGRMIVEFATVDDLERIVGIMAPHALNGRQHESGDDREAGSPPGSNPVGPPNGMAPPSERHEVTDGAHKHRKPTKVITRG